MNPRPLAILWTTTTTLHRPTTASGFNRPRFSFLKATHNIPQRIMSTAAVSNPLLPGSVPNALPRFTAIQPDHVTPAVTAAVSELESKVKLLEEQLNVEDSKQTPSYNNVLPVLEHAEQALAHAWGLCGHLLGVKNTPQLREAYQANQPAVVKATNAVQQSAIIYRSMTAILEKNNTLTRPQQRALQRAVLNMKLGGVGLEGEQQTAFNTKKLRLAQLQTDFSNHVLDATKAFGHTVTDKAIVEGVPASARELWASGYANWKKEKEAGEETVEADPENGPWRLTLDMPSYSAVVKHCRDRSTRELMYKASIRRASELEKDEGIERNNVPLILEILQLRHELAQLLGFEHYAAQSLAKKMAPSIDSIKELSETIRSKALPAAEKELEATTAYAKEQDPSITLPLQPWDVSFWSERYKEAMFSLSEEETRPYFALPKVLEGLFGLVERLFGITVKAADGEAEVWHPDVRFFHIYDSKGSDKPIASFFLDPYSRPADKRGGAWMNDCIGKSTALQQDTPVAYLVCNGSPPVGDKPSLMTFREVTTLFHEFGHGLQHMLTTVDVGDVAGISGIEWDAVELPSQFMENWCYDRPTVFGMARHWETGETLPEDMFEKLNAQKVYNAGMMACRQLLFGQLDLELHSNYDAAQQQRRSDGTSETIFDVHRRVAEQYTPYLLPLAEDRFLCTFQHIFAGGYAAGYYSYKWAEVMSADAFGAFEDAGLDKENEIQTVGRRFRETVLSMGGGEDPMTVFTKFRGREPNPEALLRHNGMA